jgi:hypothetical protein
MATGLTVSSIARERRHLERIEFSRRIVNCLKAVHFDKDHQQSIGKQTRKNVHPVTDWQAYWFVAKFSIIDRLHKRRLVEEI